MVRLVPKGTRIVMVLIEATVEVKVREWFKSEGYTVRKGENVDVEAYRDETLKHVAEAKGDQFYQSGHRKGQINEGALRNTFFMGLGQLFVAHTRHRGIRVS